VWATSTTGSRTGSTSATCPVPFRGHQIRDHITRKLAHAGLSDITIKKNSNEVEVNIRTARPGIVIGKSGTEVGCAAQGSPPHHRQADQGQILEIKRPELDAKLVAQSIAEQLRTGWRSAAR